MSSYPNVPLGQTDWQRRIAQAVNHVLNQTTYYAYTIEGMPDDGQELVDEEFPIGVTIDRNSCRFQLRDNLGVAPTSDATITLSVGGSTIATATIPAGETEGTFSFTSNDIPAFTRFLITAPSPQDATLSDFIISIAVSE